MTTATRTTLWNFTQAIATAVLLAGLLMAARLHACSGMPYPDPCKACLELFPSWLCWGCW